MYFKRPTPDTFEIGDIPPPLSDYLLQLPDLGDRPGEPAETRLYPAPTHDPSLKELVNDWRAHVHPGLHERFLSARDTVREDLKGMRETRDGHLLRFPLRHHEDWIHATNQARLVMAETHHFTEEELSQRPTAVISTPREALRFQMDLYAVIQEWIIAEVE